jgi:hypothetical protein
MPGRDYNGGIEHDPPGEPQSSAFGSARLEDHYPGIRT